MVYDMWRVLVTGVAGFIGYHLSLELAKIGYDVFGIDNLSRGDAKRVDVLKTNGVRFTLLDVRDYQDVKNFIGSVKPQIVIHLAALISVEESFKKPGLYDEVNAEGTKNVILASNSVNVDKFIYVSSAAVYGNPIKLPIDEEHPTNPLSPYGSSKLKGEFYVKNLFRGNAFVFRLFNVYGLGQNLEYAGVIVRFIERVKKGLPPIIFGDGEQCRDFIHVNDVVGIIVRSLEVNINGCEIVNVGSGKPIKIKDLAYSIIKLFNVNLEPIYSPPRHGDIKYSYADISKARRLLNWYPKISLEEGLSSMITI